VTSSPGGFQSSGNFSPITISGLTNGTAYTFTVTATSNSGAGHPSLPSVSVTPVASIVPAIPLTILAAPTTVSATASVSAIDNSPAVKSLAQAFDPNAPTILFTRAGNAQARIFFSVPNATAATTVNYTVTVLAKGVSTGILVTGPKSPIAVSGLTNGVDYTFTVTANSNTGKSLLSAPSDTLTPLAILGD
jgi:hypothetical protein